jgi:transposase
VTDFLQDHPDGVIVAMDEMSLYFQSTTTRVWFPVGQVPLVRVSPQRAVLPYYGALALRTGHEMALTLPALTGDHLVHFVRHVLICFPTQAILMFLDRAPWHKGEAVRTFLATVPRLELFFFPPACPDLNPQEHVWKRARERVSHNHALAEFGALRQAFSQYLETTFFELDWLEKYAPTILCHV